MKDPCINCPDERGGCQWTCPIGITRQRKAKEDREKARAEIEKEKSFTEYKVDRICTTKKKAGLE